MKAGYQNKPDSMRAYAERMISKKVGGAKESPGREKYRSHSPSEAKCKKLDHDMPSKATKGIRKAMGGKMSKTNDGYDPSGVRPVAMRADTKSELRANRLGYKKGGAKKADGGIVQDKMYRKADGGGIKGIAEKVIKVVNTPQVKAIASKFMAPAMKKGGKMTGGGIGGPLGAQYGFSTGLGAGRPMKKGGKMTGGRIMKKGGDCYAFGGAGKVRHDQATQAGKPIPVKK